MLSLQRVIDEIVTWAHAETTTQAETPAGDLDC